MSLSNKIDVLVFLYIILSLCYRVIHDVSLSSSAQNQALESVNVQLQQVQARLTNEQELNETLKVYKYIYCNIVEPLIVGTYYSKLKILCPKRDIPISEMRTCTWIPVMYLQ